MATTIKVDPICGMALEPHTAVARCDDWGWTYLFCCQECLDIFQKSPDHWVLYLAHSRSGYIGHIGHIGHDCRRQRKGRQPNQNGVF